jgi:hypothetical protein
VSALDVTRAECDAPDVCAQTAQDLELAALSGPGDESSRPIVAAIGHNVVPADDAIGFNDLGGWGDTFPS